MNVRQLCIASFLMTLGFALYVVSRGFVPFSIVEADALYSGPLVNLGRLGDFLPTFIHAAAFCLLCAGILNASRRLATVVCVFWGVVHATCELGQSRTIAYESIAPLLDSVAGKHALLAAVRDYFSKGVFDMADLLSAVVGCLAAYYLIALTEDKRCNRQANLTESV